eukprot:10915673-Ditylum_brightwellii.AAC.1
MVDLDLAVKDGLLAIECSYPSDRNIDELPRVWLTSSEAPWDPSMLEEEDNITIPSCWDEESEFMLATNREPNAPEDMDHLGAYHMQNQQATLFMLK